MATEPRTAVLRFENVSVSFDGEMALSDISFAAYESESRIILGAAGSGKTVLLKTAMGLTKPDSGKVFVFGQDISTMSEKKLFDIRSKIGMLFQESALFDSLNIAENVAYPLLNQPSIKCALRNWWDSAAIKQLSRELYPVGEGSHATASEVALTWYRYPETINRTQLEPRVAPNGSFADAEDYRRASPDGRIGSDPSQATPEHGKRFYDTAVADVARDYEAWVSR